MWFKEAAPSVGFETNLTAFLEQLHWNFLPEVAAIEGRRMLTYDAGPSLRTLIDQSKPVPAWENIVAVYAGLQIDLAEYRTTLLELGVPNSTPEWLRHAVPGSLPVTLIHEEVHDGNVHVLNGQPVFIDWAEASVSHPFAGMTNTLRIVSWRSGWEPGSAEVLRLRDAYLEPWTRFAPIDELRPIFTEGYALGALARARTWERILEPLDDAARRDYPHNVEAWREIYAEASGPDAKLGA